MCPTEHCTTGEPRARIRAKVVISCSTFSNADHCYTYKALYNSVSYDPSELRKIHDTVDAIILDKSEKSLITIDDVRISIASLKPGKADGGSGVLTDHIMHGGHNLHVHLCQLFNSMLIHGMSPSSLQSSTLVPIPKDKRKSLSVSDNYRAIALSSPLCKVLHTIILRK